MSNDNNTLREIPDEVKKAFEASDKYFPTPIQAFQFYDKYSRFNWDLGRRETWSETVDRCVSFLKKLSQNKLEDKVYEKIRTFMLEMKATPSMRLIAMAGKAADRQNICIYNCSFLPIDSLDAWVEALIISMSGCGVGFSVESKFVDKLPEVREYHTEGVHEVYIIPDNTDGWASALRKGLETWFNGGDISFDYSTIRPAGTILKTKGGRASGPDPLRKMLDFTRKIIMNAHGRRLTPLEAHDIMCEVGNAAVSGGMRRTAMISLFDQNDEEMRNCKNGDLTANEQRWNSNNSSVWDETITAGQVVKQFSDMDEGQRGEPGIFSRTAAKNTMPARRLNLGEKEWGTNPCGEIVLRPYEFCNLTIAIARPDDNFKDLKEKVEVATIIGTIQSMATSFPGLRQMWKRNCEEERLLGVDITGQMDCALLNRSVLGTPEDKSIVEEIFRKLRDHAVEINKEYAEKLEINQSASVTCVKPSGNSSQLFGCSSGLHARHYPYYIRNVRVSSHSPLFKVLKDSGVPMDPENGQTRKDAITWVIHFPVKVPSFSVLQSQLSAIDQCEVWLRNKLHWTEHNPSCTITYNSEELPALINWVWEHNDVIGGLSFLPKTDAKYDQMPYEEITKKEYEELSSKFPPIDFSKLFAYEEEDFTKAAQELACMSGSCDL